MKLAEEEKDQSLILDTEKQFGALLARAKDLENLCLFSGEMDHIPEVAFYMVGNIEEVVQKAERLANEHK